MRRRSLLPPDEPGAHGRTLEAEQAKLGAAGKRYQTDMNRLVAARALVLAASLVAATAVSHAYAAPAYGDMHVWQVADANQRFTLSGVVQAVDYASNTVNVKTGSQTVEIMLTPTTVIDEHGETGSVADIRKGAKISASGVIRNGRKVALSITVK